MAWLTEKSTATALTENFLTGLTRSPQRIATLIEIHSPGSNGAVPLTTITSGIEGEVTYDKSSLIRGRLRLRLVDPTGTLVPDSSSDYLTPYGNELRVYRGLVLNDATTEYVLLGTFRMATVEWDDGPDGAVFDITAYDRSRAVSRNKFTSPYTIASGTNFGTAISTLISNRYPQASLNTTFSTLTALTTPALVFPEGMDPWEACQKLAVSAGLDLYVSRSGVFTLRAEPNPATASTINPYTAANLFAYNADSATTSLVTRIRRSLTDEETYNKVVITGESTNLSAPVRGTAEDGTGTTSSSAYYTNNLASPSHTGSSYGTVPTFEQRQDVTTSQQATDLARAVLFRTLGLQEGASATIVPHPCMEVDDVFHLTRTRSGLATETSYLISSVVIPLRATAEQSVTMRAKRVFA